MKKGYYVMFRCLGGIQWRQKEGIKKLFWKLIFYFNIQYTEIFQRICWQMGKRALLKLLKEIQTDIKRGSNENRAY